MQEPALLHPPEGVPDVLPAEVHQGKGSGPRGAFIQRRHSAYRFKVNKKVYLTTQPFKRSYFTHIFAFLDRILIIYLLNQTSNCELSI